MRIIMVIERKHLFPHLSPRGFLPPDSIDLDTLTPHLFFAERDYMEANAHFKQVIPYLILQRGHHEQKRVLAYQRRVSHSEIRLGGLWSVGFGGHIEPLDRADPKIASLDLLQAAALRELAEETGLDLDAQALQQVGYINSDQDEVSSVHFGVVYLVDLKTYPADDEEILQIVSRQAEPYQARWLTPAELRVQVAPGNGPDGGTFEDWSHITIAGLYAGDTLNTRIKESTA